MRDNVVHTTFQATWVLTYLCVYILLYWDYIEVIIETHGINELKPRGDKYMSSGSQPLMERV